MRAAVRAGFVPFTAPIEGVVNYLYLDVKGLVTTAIGNLVDPVEGALSLPFLKTDGTPASRDEIAADWTRVKQDTELAHLGYRAAASVAKLRLAPEGVDLAVARKLTEMDGHLATRFPDYAAWPADAQLATLSMSWACGPGFHFPQLETALRAADFTAAAATCTINETGNPGVKPRNVANRALYLNAAGVVTRTLDLDQLYYPQLVSDLP